MARNFLFALFMLLAASCAVSEGADQKRIATPGTDKRVEEVRASLQLLKEAFEAGKTSYFMSQVSPSYSQESSRLQSDLSKVFGRAKNIALSYTFDNITFDASGMASAAVTYSMGYTDVETGKQLTRKGETTLLFRFEEGMYKLAEMRPPPLFSLE